MATNEWKRDARSCKSYDESNSTVLDRADALPFGNPEPEAVSPSDSLIPKPVAREVTRGATHENLTGGNGPQIRFRPVRYKISDFGLMNWEVFLRDDNDNIRTCSPVDVSVNGIGILVPDSFPIRVKDVFPSIEIRCDGYNVYSGRAMAVSVRQHTGGTLAGLHFLDGLLEVTKLLDLSAVKSTGDSLRRDLNRRRSTWFVDGYYEFKSIVSDFRIFLEDTYHSMKSIERQLPLHVITGEPDDVLITALKQSFLEGPSRTFCEFFSRIDRVIRESDPADTDLLKQVSRRHLHHFILEGPLFSRSLAKPRGYAGDYLTMLYIYYRHFEGTSLFSRFVHMAGCDHDVCRAVRNRKDIIRSIILDVINRPSDGIPRRIASIGSGPCEELREILETIEPESNPFEVVLFDADDEALNYCHSVLSDVIHRRNLGDVAKIVLLYDSVKHLIFDDSVFRGTGPFDLIVCSGLFDYLSLKNGQMLIAKLFAQLKSLGNLIVGNMAPGNPSRWAMEHLAEWYLIYRDRNELSDLCSNLPKYATVSVFQESLGINLFLRITAGDDGHPDH